MKESDKNLENLIDKMMADHTLESPSADFTSNIMSQVLILEKAKNKIYKPLISKSAWVFIAISIIAVVVYSTFFGGTEYNLKFETPYAEKIAGMFLGIHISKTILYAVLIVTLMILVQVGVLKNYFDKKYQL
jgi:uncharacterized membrane protein